MLSTSLRQISTRALLTLGLTVGAMTAFTSAVKAEEVFVNNPATGSVAFTQTAGAAGSKLGVTLASGLASTKIGDLNVKSNSAAGYTVKATSDNAGKFLQGANEIAYTMQFAAFNAVIGTDTVIEDVSLLNTDAASVSGLTRDVSVTVANTAVQGKPSGDYTDTVTFAFVTK